MVLCVSLLPNYNIISIISFLGSNDISLPALEAENARIGNDDGRHEAALLLDRTVNREATGRSVRTIEAMAR